MAIGLDHIPVAVRDLEAASATYRALGFALKPGRAHANGIRNAHVKFPDGAGIELLSVPAAVDPLSTGSADMIRAGDGPAFLSFHAREGAALHAALRAGGYAFSDDGGLIDLQSPELGFLFWIQDNRSPTNRPEHFAHPNGATALSAVWLATGAGDTLARLLVQLGGRQERRRVFAPEPSDAVVVTLAEGEVAIILPASHRLLPGHRNHRGQLPRPGYSPPSGGRSRPAVSPGGPGRGRRSASSSSRRRRRPLAGVRPGLVTGVARRVRVAVDVRC